MSEEQIDERIAAAVAAALKAFPKRPASPLALATFGAMLLIPLAGWTMSLSNRVAVLESSAASLQSAAIEISALKQEVADFRNEYERDRSRGEHLQQPQ